MGSDMIGLVAFDFVLGTVFRSAMRVALVVKICGMDGDDDPRHSARLGIPAHMIANLESLSHVVRSSLPAAHLSKLSGAIVICDAM
jgi:hypothetical protein